MFLRPGNIDEILMAGGVKLRGYMGAGTLSLSQAGPTGRTRSGPTSWGLRSINLNQ